jgi:hypothetical protein
MKIIVSVFFSVLFFSSCTTIKLAERESKDIEITKESFQKLQGTFSNIGLDTNHRNRTLLSNFLTDSIYSKEELCLQIEPINQKSIMLKVWNQDNLVESVAVKGKFRRGYFKVRRQWSSSFIAGPLLWILSDDLKYIGLTNTNNLVVINSGGGGLMLLVVVPIFAAGGLQFENEYVRIK